MPAAAYGSFLNAEGLVLDNGAFGISALEARSMDPQQSFVLHVGYAVLVRGQESDGIDAERGRDALM